MKTIIHVNQHIIKANTKNGTNLPALTIKTYKSLVNCHEVTIKGESKVIHSPQKPLSCGARIWIETHYEVECIIHEIQDIVISEQSLCLT